MKLGNKKNMKKKKIIKSDFFYFLLAMVGLIIVVLFSLWQVVSNEGAKVDIKTKTQVVLTKANNTLNFFDSLVPGKKLEYGENDNYEKNIQNNEHINSNNEDNLKTKDKKRRKISFSFDNVSIAEFVNRGFFVYKNNQDIYFGLKNKKSRVFSIALHY